MPILKSHLTYIARVHRQRHNINPRQTSNMPLVIGRVCDYIDEKAFAVEVQCDRSGQFGGWLSYDNYDFRSTTIWCSCCASRLNGRSLEVQYCCACAEKREYARCEYAIARDPLLESDKVGGGNYAERCRRRRRTRLQTFREPISEFERCIVELSLEFVGDFVVLLCCLVGLADAGHFVMQAHQIKEILCVGHCQRHLYMSSCRSSAEARALHLLCILISSCSDMMWSVNKGSSVQRSRDLHITTPKTCCA